MHAGLPCACRETYIQQDPGESPNDRNDRALRVAAAWYTRRLPAHTVRGTDGGTDGVRLAGGQGGGPACCSLLERCCSQPTCHLLCVQVILLTDDADNRRKAADAGVEALGSAAYARQRAAEQPELQDLVAAAAAARDGEEDGAGHGAGAGVAGKGAARAAKRQRVYEEHRLMSDIAAGMKAGRYHQGTLRWGGGWPGACQLAAWAEAALRALPGWRHAAGGLCGRQAGRLAGRQAWCAERMLADSASARARARVCVCVCAGSTASTHLRGGWAPSLWGRTSSSRAAST